MKRYWGSFLGAFLSPAFLHAQAADPMSGFVSIDQLPPSAQLPAAPLLVGAYAFVWLAAIFYIWSVWRRMNKVEADIAHLGRVSRNRGSES